MDRGEGGNGWGSLNYLFGGGSRLVQRIGGTSGISPKIVHCLGWVS